jgi:histidyl-tRNA synthetase
MSKPGLPPGTRDSDQTVHKRHFIFETIRSVFELYGYEPIETPAMENLDTLLENTRQKAISIFKIHNKGRPYFEKQPRAAFENILNGKNDKGTERALR